MSFANTTPFAALPVPTMAPDGRDVVVAIVKATFLRGTDGRLRLADQQSPVRTMDAVYDPTADASSIRYPSDIAIDKKGADVVVVGEAISRAPVKQMDVAVKAGKQTAIVRVHGERLYHRGISGVVIGPAAPFERKPIVYERAYGGTAPDASLVERRNPVGRGIARVPAALIDTPAPQIEHPGDPITGVSDHHEPAGFGAIAPHWSPRADYAGTFDAAWKATRMPLMPADFDLRFYNVAHPSLQLPARLRQGDAIAISGMSEDGLFAIEVPAVAARATARFADGRSAAARLEIDTALIEPLEGLVQLTLRHTFPMGRGRTMLREITVDVDG